MPKFPIRVSRKGLLLLAVPALAAIFAAGCSADDETGTTAVTDGSGGEDADHADDEQDHDAEDIDLVVVVEMSEFAFDPDPVEVAAGLTVRFEFANVGAIEHEAVIGDLDAQNAAEIAMAEAAGDEDHNEGAHDGAPSIVLGPGESGDLVVTFDEAGQFIIGCHIPGHWDAGMRGALTVA